MAQKGALAAQKRVTQRGTVQKGESCILVSLLGAEIAISPSLLSSKPSLHTTFAYLVSHLLSLALHEVVCLSQPLAICVVDLSYNG